MQPLTIAVSDYETDIARAIFKGLQDADIPVADIIPLSSEASQYDTASFMEQDFPVVPVKSFDFKTADAVLICGESADSREVLALAVKAGAPTLDLMNYPSGKELSGLFKKGDHPGDDFWNPAVTPVYYPADSGAMLLLDTLKPVIDAGLLESSAVTLMESASGLRSGGAMDLGRETASVLNLRPVSSGVFSTQLAFNIHTAIGDLLPDGSTSHEAGIIRELKALLPDLPSLSLTCALMPVFHGYLASIALKLAKDTAKADLEKLLAVPGRVRFLTEDEGELTPVPLARDEPEILISRLRMTGSRACSFLALSDNEGHGMAANACELLRMLAGGK